MEATKKVKWTEELVLKVVEECREAGRIAAKLKLYELQNAGPKHQVMDGSRCVGTMLDVCGFANVHLTSARGKFFQLAKKLSKERKELRFHCDNQYHGGGWFSVYDTSMRQEMSVNVASCQAIAIVLYGYGIEARVESRID